MNIWIYHIYIYICTFWLFFLWITKACRKHKPYAVNCCTYILHGQSICFWVFFSILRNIRVSVPPTGNKTTGTVITGICVVIIIMLNYLIKTWVFTVLSIVLGIYCLVFLLFWVFSSYPFFVLRVYSCIYVWIPDYVFIGITIWGAVCKNS